MSIKIVQDKFDSYKCASLQEEENAFKEIVQEIALSGLSRSDFFKRAIFQGGTCLRILYGLERFSEDVDFILKEPDTHFRWEPYIQNLQIEFQTYGIVMTVKDRSKADGTVKKAFLKSDSIGKLLTVKYPKSDGRTKNVMIKFELDTNPPKGSSFETKYLDFPFPFPVTVQDLPSLFAGKSHALLCREYTKGRDWYDFVWYVSRKTILNYEFLSSALVQTGPWKGKKISVDKNWYLKEMTKKVKSIDWEDVKQDVARFLNMRDAASVDFWSRDFFLERINKLKEYL